MCSLVVILCANVNERDMSEPLCVVRVYALKSMEARAKGTG